MKKRLLSLFLCLLTLCTSFLMAACGDDEGALEKLGSGNAGAGKHGFTTTSSNDPATICIYSIRGKGTTDEAIALVERELSRIAINRYNTAIDLILIDEEDYASMIFTKVRMAIAAHNTSLIKDIATVSESDIEKIRKNNVDYYYTDASGKKIPYGVKEATNLSSEVLNGTLDIFLCYTPEGGNGSLFENGQKPDLNDGIDYGMFEILYNEKALASLSKDLNSMYSELKNVPYSHAFEYVTRPSDPADSKSAEEIFAIPNNYTYGSYDYIIFNSEFVDEFTSPFGNGNDKSIYKDQESALYKQLKSEIAKAYEPEAYDGTTKKIFTEIEFESYEEYYDFLNGECDLSKFVKEGQNPEHYTNKFAIATINGSSIATKKLIEQDTRHKGYTVYEVKSNKIGPEENKPLDKTAEGLCDSMFCIGKNALGPKEDGARIKRCLDVLKLINTNAEFRNILQYGVKGTHYTQYSEDEDVNPINNGAKEETKYNQSAVAKYLGNMFLLYPASSGMTAEERLLAKNDWQLAKEQVFNLVPYLKYKKDVSK